MEEKTRADDWARYFLELALDAVKDGDPVLAEGFAVNAVETLRMINLPVVEAREKGAAQ